MEMVSNFFLKRNHTEVDVENMDIGILHILVSVVVFLYLMEASSEEIYLFPMSQSNLKKNSLCIDRLQCIRLSVIDAEKYLAVQILAPRYSATRVLILETTQTGK